MSLTPFKRQLIDGVEEVNQNGDPVWRGPVELVSGLSEKTFYNNNENQTEYKLVTVRYINGSGEIKTCSAKMYAGNYNKGALRVGESYLCTATRSKDASGNPIVYMQMSHLVAGAGFASVDDFEVVTENVRASVSAINS